MAVDFFLKLDGINGESADTNHKNWITLSAFSFQGNNASSVAAGTGSGAGKVNLGPLVVTKQPDSSSTKLFLNLCKGTHIATGQIQAVKSGGNGSPYITLAMTEVFITSYSLSGGSESPVEVVSLSYRTIQFTYAIQGSNGVMTTSGVAGWDLSKNAAL